MDAHESLELALTKYLSEFGDDPTPWPDSLRKTDRQGFRIFAGQSDDDKDGQSIACIANEATEEDPQYSGNFWIPVEITLRTPVAIQSDAEKADENPETEQAAALVNHKAAQSVLVEATLREEGEFADSLTEAADNFTCFGIKDFVPVRMNRDGDVWESGVKFMALCCGRAF